MDKCMCKFVTFSSGLEMVQLLKRVWPLLFWQSHWERSHVVGLPAQCCANTPLYLQFMLLEEDFDDISSCLV